MRKSALLVVGAGPYALSTAALAKRRGIECVVVGRPMSFWGEHMPEGMLLRSGVDWHLDAGKVNTLQAFLAEKGSGPIDGPIPRRLFLDYAEWFRKREELEIRPDHVHQLRKDDDGFVAELSGGDRVRADAVVAAPGLQYFPNIPAHPVTSLSPERWTHTCDFVRFETLSGRRCLIVGGRQSAFEWAALARERGAAEIHLSYRHETPAFAPSDWAWVDALVDRTVDDPGWFRRLPQQERDSIQRRFWEEGRLKLEPWLFPRIDHPNVTLWPKTLVTGCQVTATGELRIDLGHGSTVVVDHAILATGYRVDIARVPYLAPLLPTLAVRDGYPDLNEHFESSIPKLFLPGQVATQDFGAFFGFVRGCPVAAQVIVRRLLSRVR